MPTIVYFPLNKHIHNNTYNYTGLLGGILALCLAAGHYASWNISCRNSVLNQIYKPKDCSLSFPELIFLFQASLISKLPFSQLGGMLNNHLNKPCIWLRYCVLVFLYRDPGEEEAASKLQFPSPVCMPC